MSGYATTNIKLDKAVAISGIVTDQQISKNFTPSANGCLNMRIDIEATGVTVVGAITAKLYGKSPNGTYAALASTTNSQVAISATGTFSIRQNVEVTADQTNMPLPSQLAVFITTTNAGDEVTVSKIYLSQAVAR